MVVEPVCQWHLQTICSRALPVYGLDGGSSYLRSSWSIPLCGKPVQVSYWEAFENCLRCRWDTVLKTANKWLHAPLPTGQSQHLSLMEPWISMAANTMHMFTYFLLWKQVAFKKTEPPLHRNIWKVSKMLSGMQ